jgi:hypothetical protein
MRAAGVPPWAHRGARARGPCWQRGPHEGNGPFLTHMLANAIHWLARKHAGLHFAHARMLTPMGMLDTTLNGGCSQRGSWAGGTHHALACAARHGRCTTCTHTRARARIRKPIARYPSQVGPNQVKRTKTSLSRSLARALSAHRWSGKTSSPHHRSEVGLRATNAAGCHPPITSFPSPLLAQLCTSSHHQQMCTRCCQRPAKDRQLQARRTGMCMLSCFK